MNMKKYFMKLILAIVLFLSVGTVCANAEDTLQSKIDSAGTIDEIILNTSYTEDITVLEGKTLTIDLNNNTITGLIKVYGSLTIEDPDGNGKIINDKALEADGGVITLESGTVNITNDYGFYALNGGKVIINGGVATSKYAVLTGNNNSGIMNFEVNNGVLTAEQGPALYITGPGVTKIAGGTINGGISVRMGDIEISGGVVNSITTGIDSPASYYNYKGNAWFPDALYVFGGTYTSQAEGVSNDLNLKITGGAFNCNNDQGSAIAIYDLGKVSQKMNVEISGSAELKTLSTTRSAYDVLSFEDIGVAEPKAGYGLEEYIGKITTKITGGSFSAIKNDYISSGYAIKKVDDLYVVGSQEIVINAPQISSQSRAEDGVVLAIENSEAVQDILTSSLKESGLNITGINPIIEVQVTNQDETEVGEAVIEKITEKVTTENKNIKIANYFDITLEVRDPNNNDAVIGNLTELNSKIKLTLAVPEELNEIASGYTRNFYIIKYHGNEVTIIKANYNTETKLLDFESDGFSTYALAYEDVETSTIRNPKTVDNILFYVGIGMISLVGFVGAGVYLKKRVR